MQELHISVRNLVEFILRSGDIDNRSGRMVTDAMLEGGRIHRSRNFLDQRQSVR